MSNPIAASTNTSENVAHHDMANALRALAMDAIQKSNSGHPGMPMGMADVATVLYQKFLKFDASNPTWPDRDRFVLSAGHGSMLLYGLNYLTGYEKITLDEIKNFRQLGAITNGHPEVNFDAGIETTTGPLGQGIANAVGMALAEQILQKRFGKDITDHFTYAIAGDGCLMEGISHEACSLAGHLGLGKLIVLYDDNKICIDGPTDMTFTDDTLKRFEAYGWDVVSIDGHNPEEITKAIAEAQISTDKPSLIACRTEIGRGSPNKAGSSSCHGSPLGDDEIKATKEALGWPHDAFVIPDNVLDAWREIGSQGREDRRAWQIRLDGMDSEQRNLYDRALSGRVDHVVAPIIQEFKEKMAKEQPKVATRAASGQVLEALIPALPSMVGGSADLTGSNLTKTKEMGAINKDSGYEGQYVYYGVREHAMAAMMNGMALHKGILPYGGTFMCFTDYCRPSIRLSALMEQRVVYVMTHDSIGLGEDGPTHQPVEHLSSLRAMPNTNVYRPADIVETAECWEMAIKTQETPSILSLTRQGLPTLRTEFVEENKCAKGAYIMREAEAEHQVTIMASGSEVEIALEAKAQLEADNIGTRVISVPCFELFEQQDSAYRQELLCNDTVHVAIEAACSFGWERYIGAKGIFIGLDRFGDSAPANELYEKFGITAENTVAKVKERLAKRAA